MLKGKKILLGVCGSIAAYKAAFLVRLLVKAGAEVQVVMTESAREFITPLTLATLSKRPVLADFVADSSKGTWNNHVELGLWADLILIAPASAHTLAKLAHGICNDLLSSVYLSARCPVMLAPAMDLDMYQHPSTRANLQTLQSYGNQVIDAESGELASGLSGQGRMSEPENIVKVLDDFFNTPQPLLGKKILLTAGPTQEAIDPVRFISNASSGKMGYALAEALSACGAEVTLVSGPSKVTLADERINLIPVHSGQQMYEAAKKYFEESHIAIFAAAVSDYRPREVYDKKIKKNTEHMTMELVKNIDIAKTLSSRKKPSQFTVGFALETHDEEENARKKIREKHFDMIVLNSLNDPGAGFGYDTNKVRILLSEEEESVDLPLKSKKEIAKDIVRIITEKSHA